LVITGASGQRADIVRTEQGIPELVGHDQVERDCHLGVSEPMS